MKRVLPLVFLAAACRAGGVEGAGRIPDWPIRPGDNDARVTELLRESLKVVHLGKTALKEVAPELHVEVDAELKLDEAVAYANEHFADDRARRALFLWRFIGNGMPEERLSLLRLERSGRDGQMNGTLCRSYLVDPTERPAGKAAGQALLMFQISAGPDRRLFGNSKLFMRGRTFRGMSFSSLSFDRRGLLRSFFRGFPADERGVKVEVSGSDYGDQGIRLGGFVVVEGMFWDSVRFDAGFSPTRRYVHDSAKGRSLYDDRYRNGKLVERKHYRYYNVTEKSARYETTIERFDQADEAEPDGDGPAR